MKAHTLALLFGCFAAYALCCTASAIAEENKPASAVKDDGGNTESSQDAFQSVLQFKLIESAFTDEKNSIESSEITLQDVPWKIIMHKVKKEGEDNKYSLKTVVKSNFNGEASKWSCAAEAIFVLKKFGSGPDDLSKTLKKTTFSRAKSENVIDELTDWDTLQKYLDTDKVATFEITLKISPLNRALSDHVLEQMSTVFYFNVPDVNSPNSTRSNDVFLRGIHWYLKAMKLKTNDAETLGIYLYANQKDMDFNLQWKVSASFTLLSTKKDGHKTEKIDHVYHWRSNSWGYWKFIDWATLTDESKGYIENNGAIFKIEFSVAAPTLLSPPS